MPKWLTKHQKIIRFFLSLMVASVVIIHLSGLAYIADQPRKWIRALYGIKCNTEGQEHGNTDLKTALYFNSIEECAKTLKK